MASDQFDSKVQQCETEGCPKRPRAPAMYCIDCHQAHAIGVEAPLK